jgi:ketopantoate reductase
MIGPTSFIVVGAGAVGGVIGTLLEHAGYRVCYWARPGQRRLPRLLVQRAGGTAIESRPLTWIDASTQPLPDSDWVLVCVRTEQLTAALDEIASRLGPDRGLVIATVTLEGALAAARTAGMRGPVLALHVSFGSRQLNDDPSQLEWFAFTPATTVSAEGQRELSAPARELARTLAGAGIPTRPALSISGVMSFMVTLIHALLPSWELCDWDLRRLARDRSLRRQTARAMRETALAFAADGGSARRLARAIPCVLYDALLRVLPWLMGTRARRLWLVHGPKISAQTGYFVRELLARAERAGRPLPALAELNARCQARARRD